MSRIQEKSTFITRKRLYEFVHMPFGLCNGPATYSRAMGAILNGLAWNVLLTFLDDICVLGKIVKDQLFQKNWCRCGCNKRKNTSLCEAHCAKKISLKPSVTGGRRAGIVCAEHSHTITLPM
ncbi:hypothetical protein RRG08_015216 [Elysia crispata]|uniref:Reverse transcriptase domain-containing protein n=1 Tax=Elysia crispata TaxID=231223 RepID=A0AAE1DTN2_9GAST|nr:hypothetical protein RRG08_015216 [Elysia crispata]